MTVLDRYRCFYCLLTDGQSARGSVATVCNPVVAVSKNVPSRLSLERMVATLEMSEVAVHSAPVIYAHLIRVVATTLRLTWRRYSQSGNCNMRAVWTPRA
jgi:hypothetical protein